MSYYRIYAYPFNGELPFRHLYFYGERPAGVERAPVEHSEVKLSESLRRSRRLVRDLALCNRFDLFATFTFDDALVNRGDFGECQRKLTNFFRNYRQRRASGFRYLAVPELHEDGKSWHYHALLRGIPASDFCVPETILKRVGDELKQVPNTRGYVRWKSYKLGFFDCSVIRSRAACARYIAKYITKGLEAVAVGRQVVLHSKDLLKPELVFDEDNIPCGFDAQYESQYHREAFISEGQTVGDYLSQYWFVPADRVTEPEQPFFPEQLTLSQLSMLGQH